MMTQELVSQVALADCAVVITRTINAPRELVFEAFTNAEQIVRWFGPDMYSATAEIEPHLGGKFSLTLYGPADAPAEVQGPFPLKGEFLEFDRPSKIVYTADMSGHPESWKQEMAKHMGDPDANFLKGVVTITFEPVNGKTVLTIISNFESNMVRDGFANNGMTLGWDMSLTKLEALLTNEQ